MNMFFQNDQTLGLPQTYDVWDFSAGWFYIPPPIEFGTPYDHSADPDEFAPEPIINAAPPPPPPNDQTPAVAADNGSGPVSMDRAVLILGAAVAVLMLLKK